MSSEPTAGIGHNNPAQQVPPTNLEERLREVHQAEFQEAEKWLASALRAPASVESDEDYGKFSTLAGRLITVRNSLDKSREAEKAPYLAAGRAVDTLFRSFIDRCKDAQDSLEKRQRVYARRKEDEARAAAAKAAAEEKARADAALREAERAQDKGDFDTADTALREATQAEEAAHEAEKVAESAPAELTRVRAASGAVASAKVEWAHEIIDLAKIDLNTLRPYFSVETIDKAVKAAVRAGVRQMDGVRIYEDRKIKNRGI